MKRRTVDSPRAASAARRRFAAGAATAVVLVLGASPARAGLCGDAGGDGYFTVSDALADLRMAVGGGYDRRGDVAPEGSGGDGKIRASDALASLKAVVEDRIPRCRGATASRAVVTAAPYDFKNVGGFAVVDIGSRHADFRSGAIRADAVIRVPGGTPVVINRHTFSTLQILDTNVPALPTINECSVSGGLPVAANPQDIALVSPDKGYVTPYAGSELFVISPPVLFEPELDPSCKSLIAGTIDLSGFDPDGIPQMDQMLVLGDRLFVSLQLLDNQSQPAGQSVLAVVDTATDTVTGSIELAFRNPFAQTKGLVWDEFQKRIFVGGPGNTGDVLDDGGIEAVDPESMESDGLILSGADIHANIFDFVIVGTDRAFAIVADNVSNSVVEIDLTTRSISRTLVSSTALITDIEMTELGELWVAYRGETAPDPPGIRIFRVRDGVELTKSPIGVGLPPFTLAFVD